MNDLISRQEAIDAFAKLVPYVIDDDYAKAYADGLSAGYGVICRLSSAQPEQRWIPCSERLPEDGEYLVLYYTRSQYKPYVYDVISFANDLYQIDEYDFPDKIGQKGWFYIDRDYGYCEDNSVLAWMPLPEPYREENGK